MWLEVVLGASKPHTLVVNTENWAGSSWFRGTTHWLYSEFVQRRGTSVAGTGMPWNEERILSQPLPSGTGTQVVLHVTTTLQQSRGSNGVIATVKWKQISPSQFMWIVYVYKSWHSWKRQLFPCDMHTTQNFDRGGKGEITVQRPMQILIRIKKRRIKKRRIKKRKNRERIKKRKRKE